MLSIIIPTFNQRERLAVTLENLAKQERIEHTTVYVVNDGSTDGTKQWLDELDYSWLVPIHQENRGEARQEIQESTMHARHMSFFR